MAGRFQPVSAMQAPHIESVLISLRRVIRATDLHSRDLIRTTGLTAPQLLLLQTLRTNDLMSVSEIAQDMRLSQATVTSILDRLEQRGYVVREKSREDKRRVHTHLTELGRDAVKDAPVPLQESFVRQFRELKEWEQNMIISALQRVAEMMDAQDLDASPVLDVGTLDRAPESARANATGKTPRTAQKRTKAEPSAATAAEKSRGAKEPTTATTAKKSSGEKKVTNKKDS